MNFAFNFFLLHVTVLTIQAPMYYRRANAAVIVYDITNENSFVEARSWVKGEIDLV